MRTKHAPKKGSEEHLHNCEVRLFICVAGVILFLLLVAMWLVGLYQPPRFQWAVVWAVPWVAERWMDRRWPT
jgi:hypothetical protein